MIMTLLQQSFVTLMKPKTRTEILKGHINVRSHFVIKPSTLTCANLFMQKFLRIRYFLHIITTVYSLLYLAHNSSLSVLLSAKEHHNYNVNTKTHLFISGTILIRFSLYGGKNYDALTQLNKNKNNIHTTSQLML